jgi:uroporphyrinogen-III synthase
MHVLVTRPEPDSLKLVGLLEQHGHEALAAPLSSFVSLGLDVEALEGITGLVATSRNALRALVGSEALAAARNLTVFAVGNATAEEARRMGFSRVVKGPGTAADLGPLIASLVDPAEEMLLYLAGDRLAHDLAGELQELGVRIDSRVVYRMEHARSLPVSAVSAIRAREIDAVVLMSQQAAHIWTRLVVAHHLEEPVRDMLHLCLSDSVARRLAPLRGVEVEAALVDSAAAKLGE